MFKYAIFQMISLSWDFLARIFYKFLRFYDTIKYVQFQNHYKLIWLLKDITTYQDDLNSCTLHAVVLFTPTFLSWLHKIPYVLVRDQNIFAINIYG